MSSRRRVRRHGIHIVDKEATKIIRKRSGICEADELQCKCKTDIYPDDGKDKKKLINYQDSILCTILKNDVLKDLLSSVRIPRDQYPRLVRMLQHLLKVPLETLPTIQYLLFKNVAKPRSYDDVILKMFGHDPVGKDDVKHLTRLTRALLYCRGAIPVLVSYVLKLVDVDLFEKIESLLEDLTKAVSGPPDDPETLKKVLDVLGKATQVIRKIIEVLKKIEGLPAEDTLTQKLGDGGRSVREHLSDREEEVTYQVDLVVPDTIKEQITQGMSLIYHNLQDSVKGFFTTMKENIKLTVASTFKKVQTKIYARIRPFVHQQLKKIDNAIKVLGLELSFMDSLKLTSKEMDTAWVNKVFNTNVKLVCDDDGCYYQEQDGDTMYTLYRRLDMFSSNSWTEDQLVNRTIMQRFDVELVFNAIQILVNAVEINDRQQCSTDPDGYIQDPCDAHELLAILPEIYYIRTTIQLAQRLRDQEVQYLNKDRNDTGQQRWADEGDDGGEKHRDAYNKLITSQQEKKLTHQLVRLDRIEENILTDVSRALQRATLKARTSTSSMRTGKLSFLQRGKYAKR